jgi:hypothetical protein
MTSTAKHITDSNFELEEISALLKNPSDWFAAKKKLGSMKSSTKHLIII